MFFNGLGPSYKTFLSSFIANHDIIPSKREDGTDAEVATFQHAPLDFATFVTPPDTPPRHAGSSTLN
ncbi:hypothetical protein E4U40_002040 [Claviceps sp. LM458 group G5]|nr:hypothetical protein E4U40_002040 [Claviceps sp. LM458 group G5]